MTLAFRTHIDGKPTYFMDKIWHSFPKEIFTDDNFGYDMKHFKIFGNMMWQLTENRPKKHTIREDKKNRWKVGNNIHFVINNRTKKRFQFAPVIPVTCIQQINIDYKNSNNTYPIITISIEGTDVSIPVSYTHLTLPTTPYV